MSSSPRTVYFFGTCLIDSFYPQAGMAAIRLIQRQGVDVVFPREQGCCGQPAYNSGFPDEAREVARKQVDLFSKSYPIVVPSGSCAGMMKHHYPALFSGTPDAERALAFSSRIYELTEFLVRILDIRLEDRGRPTKVTWHSSCHALREMDVIEDSKALIGQLRNVELVELKRETECCGFGGTFAIKQPQISAAMVGDKVRNVSETDAAVLLTGDCGCLMNITGAMDKMGVPVKGQHIAEFIWERINA
jgi:L-lactate dehydrogenase complex protein LldE